MWEIDENVTARCHSGGVRVVTALELVGDGWSQEEGVVGSGAGKAGGTF